MTWRPRRPVMVSADHRPISLVSDDGSALVPHLFPAIVNVPPGWKFDWNWIAELEKANVVREKYRRSIVVVDALLSFQHQSVLVSTNPRTLAWSSWARAPIWCALSCMPFMFWRMMRQPDGGMWMESPNGVLSVL